MAETIAMPKLGFDMQEGTLVRWVRVEGESINKGDVLAEIETDKATVEVESSASGVVRKLLVDQGAIVPIGAPIAIVGSKDEKIETPAASPAAAVVPETQGVQRTVAPSPPRPMTVSKAVPSMPAAAEAVPRRASPLARRLAQDAKLDLTRVQGTGPGGRIVRKDIESALSGTAATPVAHPLSVIPAVVPVAGEDKTVPLSRLRQAIARRMAESKSTVPHFYVTHEYNAERLVDLREQANADLQDDEKLSINDFVIKAAALCLRAFPNLNAAFGGDHVVQRGAINIGVAVAVEGGLLTVVCKGADQKPLRQISAEVRAMAGRARAGKVHPEDIEGSTFTVSNLGMFDVESFSAIINPPEAAILAVGAARQVAVVQDGEVQAGWRMKATVAVDHRVSDGAEAAQFMQALAKYLESPVSMLL